MSKINIKVGDLIPDFKSVTQSGEKLTSTTSRARPRCFTSIPRITPRDAHSRLRASAMARQSSLRVAIRLLA